MITSPRTPAAPYRTHLARTHTHTLCCRTHAPHAPAAPCLAARTHLAPAAPHCRLFCTSSTWRHVQAGVQNEMSGQQQHRRAWHGGGGGAAGARSRCLLRARAPFAPFAVYLLLYTFCWYTAGDVNMYKGMAKAGGSRAKRRRAKAGARLRALYIDISCTLEKHQH